MLEELLNSAGQSALEILSLIVLIAMLVHLSFGLFDRGKSAQPLARDPVLSGANGIRYDFNDGCRVSVPHDAWPWRVRISDEVTGEVLVDERNPRRMVSTHRKYHFKARIDVWRGQALVLTHCFDALGKLVVIHIDSPALGDTIASMTSITRFQKEHACRVVVRMQDTLIQLFAGMHPSITFLGYDDVVPSHAYATYVVPYGRFQDRALAHNPVEFRRVGLLDSPALILGLYGCEGPPPIMLPRQRTVPGRYVCIAITATSPAKLWLNRDGWPEIVAFMRAIGFRVLCIDTLHWPLVEPLDLPEGSEDFTGKSLADVCGLLGNADLMIGLSSGLSWLAWALEVPVVVISGFTNPKTEFATPYRVINTDVCNSCWNDPAFPLNVGDTCPRHEGTARAFECTRAISAAQVIAMLKTLPCMIEAVATHDGTMPDHDVDEADTR